MARRGLLHSLRTVASIALLSAPVLAADRALIDVIGYSEDQRYFAFEEFGVQDGSGLAYSSIYVIDMREDRWVVGTPVRVQAEDETETLKQVRDEARADAMPRLDDLRVNVPAELLAAIGSGVPDVDGKTLAFGLPGFGGSGEVRGNYTVTLETFATTAGSPCEDWFAEPPVGFALSVSDFGPAREVHRDAVLARSRGCPAEYGIFGVYAPFQATDITRTVALISVDTYGFEGLDRRFIAQPLAFPALNF